MRVLPQSYRFLAIGVAAAATVGIVAAAPATAQERSGPPAEEKAAEDPTKIATKAGIAYAGELSVSGSLAFGPKFKVNGRVANQGNGRWAHHICSRSRSSPSPRAAVSWTRGRSRPAIRWAGSSRCGNWGWTRAAGSCLRRSAIPTPIAASRSPISMCRTASRSRSAATAAMSACSCCTRSASVSP